MAKISSGLGTALVIGIAILGLPTLVSFLSGDQHSTSLLSNTNTNVNYETPNEGTSAVSQKVSCLGMGDIKFYVKSILLNMRYLG